mgnify:CR=1 FL=1
MMFPLFMLFEMDQHAHQYRYHLTVVIDNHGRLISIIFAA